MSPVRKQQIDDQLRAAIKASGQTHYAIAKGSGVTPAMIDRFVSGERDIRFATAAKIASYLGLTLATAGADA